jgi:hypothetical protein
MRRDAVAGEEEGHRLLPRRHTDSETVVVQVRDPDPPSAADTGSATAHGHRPGTDEKVLEM